MNEIIWRKKVECVGSRIDDALVLLNVDDGMYLSMNDTAADIWEALDSPQSETSLVNQLIGKYRISLDDCSRSVHAYIEKLAEMGLIKQQSSSASSDSA